MIIVYSAESTATTMSNNLQTYLWHVVYIYICHDYCVQCWEYCYNNEQQHDEQRTNNGQWEQLYSKHAATVKYLHMRQKK